MVQRRPLFIPFRLRCLLAFAWLAHKTFPGSPMPKIVPPFIRCRIQHVILAFSWSAARTFMGSPKPHASGRAKNRTPFHLATLALIQPPGLQQAGGRVHQGIARHGRLAKNRAPYLIRRDETSMGALLSNTILRFEKAPYTYHLVQRCPVRVAWLFYRYFGRSVWPCFCRSSRPWRGLCVSIHG